MGGVYSSEGQSGRGRNVNDLGHCWEGGLVEVELVVGVFSSEGKSGRGRYVDDLGHCWEGGVVDLEWVGGVSSSEGQSGRGRYVDDLGHCWEGGAGVEGEGRGRWSLDVWNRLVLVQSRKFYNRFNE